ncbi:MAG: response regulator [Burkholderiales bacterium]|nr:response regulator [Burkholderiales bacterium]
MADHDAPATTEAPLAPRRVGSVRLVGFSGRDRELLRLFLRRPPGASVSLAVVDEGGDTLIANALHADGAQALEAWRGACPAIGIVERCERDAPFYQVAQNSQMLFSLAQAITRIVGGWQPPLPPAEDVARAVDLPLPSPTTLAPAASAAASSSQPRSDGAAVAAASAAASLPWQRALNVLVIDDSHFSREAVSAALVKVGFAVDTADGGENGLRRAAEKAYDVALVDFEMPGMQGPEVLRRLRALGAQSPSVLIMLTARTGAVDRLRAKFAGCDAYLTKPTRMREFLSVLRDCADAGKLARS